jgi:hypothetical protein
MIHIRLGNGNPPAGKPEPSRPAFAAAGSLSAPENLHDQRGCWRCDEIHSIMVAGALTR